MYMLTHTHNTVCNIKNGFINIEYIVYIVPNSLLIRSVISLMYKHLRVTVCCSMWKLSDGNCIGVQ